MGSRPGYYWQEFTVKREIEEILLFKACLSNDSKKSDEYAKLLVESMGGSEIDNTINENKIIKNIAREVIIYK